MLVLQEKLPEDIEAMSPAELRTLVYQCKSQLGSSCVILGHHYQKDEVIEFSDVIGDSLKLARFARDHKDAKYIVFCGVHFMAETADILTSPQQLVSLPDLNAGCDMADMADITDVEDAWAQGESIADGKIIPVTYINSTAALKDFVGRHGGVICTSSNAQAVIEWALKQGNHVFFFPDQHLGRNIAKQLGFSPDTDMILWDPEQSFGGQDRDVLRSRKIWLWKGHCPVHALFTLHQIERIRAEDPAVQVVVHPECAMEVVDAADDVGSTEYIIKKVKAGSPGSKWAVGTEKHLVERLAAECPDKTVFSLNRFSCLCATMNRISLKHLAWVLRDLREGRGLRNQITVSEDISRGAILALDRMFQLS